MEDCLVFEYFSELRKTGGTFIEIGALDGMQFSNSWAFERCLNWTGVLVEGNSKNYKMLLAQRPRNSTRKIQSAICKKKDDKFVNFTIEGG
jgi:hypothetical protein